MAAVSEDSSFKKFADVGEKREQQVTLEECQVKKDSVFKLGDSGSR